MPEDLLKLLPDPAYQHVLLSHLPLAGLLAGAIALLIALLMGERAAQVPALFVIILISGSAFLLVDTGHDAYRPVRAIADGPGADWLDE
ncbi:MAG: hypothetical protein WA771_11925, partial [Chthoniobacterales bacterium]